MLLNLECRTSSVAVDRVSGGRKTWASTRGADVRAATHSATCTSSVIQSSSNSPCRGCAGTAISDAILEKGRPARGGDLHQLGAEHRDIREVAQYRACRSDASTPNRTCERPFCAGRGSLRGRRGRGRAWRSHVEHHRGRRACPRRPAVRGCRRGAERKAPVAAACRSGKISRLPARPPDIVVTMSTAMPFPTPDDTAETYWDGFYRGLNQPADSAPGPNALFVDEVGAPRSTWAAASAGTRSGSRGRGGGSPPLTCPGRPSRRPASTPHVGVAERIDWLQFVIDMLTT
jgi:hypothetical protein